MFVEPSILARKISPFHPPPRNRPDNPMAQQDDAGDARSAEKHGAPAASRSMAGMNVVMFITDQERAIQHFPPGWARENLPGLTRLQRHGVSFERAFTNSCMCSPARTTLMTAFFPPHHAGEEHPE